MLDTIIHQEPDSVNEQLSQLGIKEIQLQEAVRLAYIQRTILTSHHPKIMFGLLMWSEIVAGLRDQLKPFGYQKFDKGNYELAVHSELGIGIAVASGDPSTGTSSGTPANKCPKGVNTVQAIETNRQLDLFAGFPDMALLIQDDINLAGVETWVLLHHIAKNEIRIELSKPSEIDSSGIIYGWSKRIIIGSIPLDDDSISIAPPPMPDIDIDIFRKEA